MAKVAFLTFNDAPGGIFSSQVIDVCYFLRDELKQQVTLISFISIRGFFGRRIKIKEQFPDAIVLPMWPGIQRWRNNAPRLKRCLRKLNPDTIIARGPFAAVLARSASGARVCFDARGAYSAEFGEYKVGGDKFSPDDIHEIEKRALNESDCAIAVSEALVNYWKREFAYQSGKHVVIPCTLPSAYRAQEKRESGPARVRIVFSGGTGKWQSLELLSEILLPYFETHPETELLMLTSHVPDSFVLKRKFPDRVLVKWVKEEQVSAELATCDYGWLVREENVTNEVASPVKFAEYLAAGLSVLISPKIGDFSSFVAQHQCGYVISNKSVPELQVLTAQQRKHNRALAAGFFVKTIFADKYRRCLA